MNLAKCIYVSPENFPRIYADHCRIKGKRFVPSCVQLSEGGPIDLCTLYNCVVFQWQVSHRKLWPEIAAKLGFVHVPATNTEPARSSTELARQLERVYDVYLFDFEYVVVDYTAQRMVREWFPEIAAADPPGGPWVVAGQKVKELLEIIPYSLAELRWQKAPLREAELLEQCHSLFWYLRDIQEFDERRTACRPRRDDAEERGARRSPHAGRSGYIVQVGLALEQRQYVDAGTRQGLFSVQRLTWLRDTWRAWKA